MRSAPRALLLATTALAVVGSVLAAGFELSADTMRDAEDTVHRLDSSLSLQDPKAALADVDELAHYFEQVESHYAQRGDKAQAAEFAKQSQQQAALVGQAVQRGDFDAAQDVLSQLTRSCKRCHEAYRRER